VISVITRDAFFIVKVDCQIVDDVAHSMVCCFSCAAVLAPVCCDSATVRAALLQCCVGLIHLVPPLTHRSPGLSSLHQSRLTVDQGLLAIDGGAQCRRLPGCGSVSSTRLAEHMAYESKVYYQTGCTVLRPHVPMTLQAQDHTGKRDGSSVPPDNSRAAC
jgi:hypothetical protein